MDETNQLLRRLITVIIVIAIIVGFALWMERMKHQHTTYGKCVDRALAQDRSLDTCD